MAECYQEEQRFQLGLTDDAAECFVRGGGRKGGGGGGGILVHVHLHDYEARQHNTTI